MFLTSRWFPPNFALLLAAVYLALIGYDYWAATQKDNRFNAREFLQRDLQHPLFEPYGFCGGWTHYSGSQSAAIGLYAPAFLTAALIESIVNRQRSCGEWAATPRGQLVTLALGLILWFLVGMSIRRLAQRRWRQAAAGWVSVTFISLRGILLTLGVGLLLLSLLGLFASVSLSTRLVGLASWVLYAATLCAKRPDAGHLNQPRGVTEIDNFGYSD